MTGNSGQPPTTIARRSATRSGAATDQARVIRRYLSAIEAGRPGRGGKRAQDAVTSRIVKVDELLVSADPLTRVHLTQERIELHAEQVRLGNNSAVDLAQLEREFVRVARSYSDRHGLTYAAWRQVGVATEVLDRAGIFRADRKPPTPKGDKVEQAGAGPASAGVDASAAGTTSSEEGSEDTAASGTTVTASGSGVSANGRSGGPQGDQAPAPSADEAIDDGSGPARAAVPLELADERSGPAGGVSSRGRSARPDTGT